MLLLISHQHAVQVATCLVAVLVALSAAQNDMPTIGTPAPGIAPLTQIAAATPHLASPCDTTTPALPNPCATAAPQVPSPMPFPGGVSATCDAYPCPGGTILKPNPSSIPCLVTSGCTAQDAENCCMKVLTTAAPSPGVVTTATTTMPTGVCSGVEEEWKHCDNPPCGFCTPIPCVLSTWAEWYAMGGCTNLCVRERFVQTTGNECGVRCSGALSETKVGCEVSTCGVTQDCKFGDWGRWYGCAHEEDQKYRTRAIIQSATFDGAACNGSKTETAPCTTSSGPVDCELSEWHEWTDCSAQCGGGHQSRVRRISTLAKHGGNSCEGALNQQRECNTAVCTDLKDCVMGEWQAWEGCDEERPGQRYREREITEPAHGAGKPCNDVVRQIEGCSNSSNSVCTFSDWTPWHGCSKTCGGGQDFRCRHPRHVDGVKCPDTTLVFTVPCATQPCPTSIGEGENDVACKFDAWTEWSECNNDCGQGVQKRTRTVVGPLSEDQPCVGLMNEVKPCKGEASHCTNIVDCKWEDWGTWTGCTRTCGAGTKSRERAVAKMPVGGGALCDSLDKAEVVPCSTQSCRDDTCIDGAWADWEQWSTCNAGECQSGYRTRNRIVATPANSCGSPAEGSSTQYKVCEGPPPAAGGTCDRNCTYMEWNDWTDCTCSCFGIRDRTRQVKEYKRGNFGLPCAGAMKETEQCNPGPNQTAPQCGTHLLNKDCTMAAWTEWGECSATCGGGYSRRQRFILQLPGKTGMPCNSDLSQVMSCSTQLCPSTSCVDCKWSKWEDWGVCSLGGDQKYRRRTIANLGNSCGKICDSGPATEMTNCSSDEEGGKNPATTYCAWTAWSDYEPCPHTQTCGPATKRRFRELHSYDSPPEGSNGTWLMKGARADQCLGEQAQVTDCGFPPCQLSCSPKECVFNDWSDWGEASCQGLCERERTIRSQSSCGANPCSGDLMESKRCKPTCTEPVDCLIGDWTPWSSACLLGPKSQTYRNRPIIHMPANGGKTCQGPIRETRPCAEPIPYMDCEMTDWGEWAPCERTCGGGWQLRKRHISTPGLGGGKGCEGTNREMQACNTQVCEEVKPQDCIWGAWNPWGVCETDRQQFRAREVETAPAGGGKACVGGSGEVRACAAVDCDLSAWTEWGQCDKTCDGGQRIRNRQIHQLAMFGGNPCPYPLDTVEVEGCNKEGCNPDQDCTVSEWSDWGACSTSCGTGQQDRFRAVTHLRMSYGEGCQDNMGETRNCSMGYCPDIDCMWGLWSDWSTCSLTCGSGERSRERKISSSPKSGGRACQAETKSEVQPCVTKPCENDCVDGEWGSWGAWSVCPVTCGGALQFRTRVVAVEPNYCGAGVVGPTQEWMPCGNVTCFGDRDCVLGDWGAWGACSSSCDGVMRLERRIVSQGSGKGKFCNGPLKVFAPCNPSPGQMPPKGCEHITPAVHCKWSDWVSTQCSRPCGGGQLTRSRNILTPANQRGDGCQGPILETVECNRLACDGKAIIDCKFSVWSDWGSCDKCGGQKRRTRHIETQAENGGRPCEPGSDVETHGCPRKCAGGQFCTWVQWSEWSGCSSTCDGGTKSRRRTLELTLLDSDPPPDISVITAKFEEFDRIKEDQSVHTQALLMAFAGGCLTFILLGTAFHVFRRSLRERSQRTQMMGYSSLNDGADGQLTESEA